jgi:hypothetical protein
MKWFIEFAAVSILPATLPTVVGAVKPTEFTATGTVAVTSISEPIPTGKSGRVAD